MRYRWWKRSNKQPKIKIKIKTLRNKDIKNYSSTHITDYKNRYLWTLLKGRVILYEKAFGSILILQLKY
jgi:hypothetical protein